MISPLISKTFKNVGRIRQRAGTTNVRIVKQLPAMLENLYANGKLDVLEAIRDNRMTLMEAYGKWQSGGPNAIKGIQSVFPAVTAFTLWLQTHPITPKARKDYKGLFGLLGVKDEAVEDLPRLIRSFRDKCAGNGHHSTFNAAKAVVRSFLTNSYGQRSPVLADVRDIENFSAKPKRRNKAHEVKIIKALMAKLPEDAAKQVWSLCLTMMRPFAEYEPGRYEVKADRIKCHGQKTNAAERVVPLIEPVPPCVVKESKFGKLVRKASDYHVQVYDFRRSGSYWYLCAGVPLPRVDAYMGHEDPNLTLHYASPNDVSKWLVEDADAIRKWIATQ